MALADYAQQDKTRINVDITRMPSGDMRFMARQFASSMHVPAEFAEKPATVNFWSTEEGGFPAPAVKLLEQVAKEMLP